MALCDALRSGSGVASAVFRGKALSFTYRIEFGSERANESETLSDAGRLHLVSRPERFPNGLQHLVGQRRVRLGDGA